MRSLTELTFDNSYARLAEVFYARVSPQPFANPFLVSFNPAAAELLELKLEEDRWADVVEYFGGKKNLPGAEPIAMVYAGHQFGQYLPRLGDGRAILLGEVLNQAGESWHLHLKGAGPTPFARGYDGRAVLRSVIREYLGSEAMHGLGIPTERGLCVMSADELVKRRIVAEEVEEKVGMLLRLAPSFVRIGSFEFFHYRGEDEHVTRLCDHIMEKHFPALTGHPHKYQEFLRQVVVSTGRLLAHWQAVGFVHGAFNTDNTSVLGFTLDYGPFGFLDQFRMNFVTDPHTDRAGRFAFGRQPGVALWNLYCFARTMLHLISREEALAALSFFDITFDEFYGQLIRAKLGLKEHRPEDAALVQKLLRLLEDNAIDYSIFFRQLGRYRQRSADKNAVLRDSFKEAAQFDEWAELYEERLRLEQSDDDERRQRMDRVNPKYILRTYMTHTAVELAHAGDYSEIERLLALLRDPFSEQPAMARYAGPPPEWATDIKITVAS